MIYDVTVSLQEVLDCATHVASEPALNEERDRNVSELEEQRLRSHERLQLISKAAHEKLEKATRDERQRKLDAEKGRMRVLRVKEGFDNEPDAADVQARGGVQFDQPMVLENSKGIVQTFRTVQNLTEYRQGPIMKVSMVQIWGSPMGSPPPLVLKQCQVQFNATVTETFRQQVQGLESKIDMLKRAGHHPSVVTPLGLSIRRAAFNVRKASDQPSATVETGYMQTSTTEEWTFSFLAPFLENGSLQQLLDIVGNVSAESTRAWTFQLIEGLNFLHRNGITHGRVHCHNILLEKKDGIQATVKLADAAFQTEVYQIMNKDMRSLAWSAPWIPPEKRNAVCQATNATDIWDLALCISQMLFGLDVQSRYCSPTELLDDSRLTVSLRKFLGQMFRSEPGKRSTAFELLPAEFLRSQENIFRALVADPQTHIESAEPKSPRLRRESTNTPLASRYRTDFVELGRLGRGGYGEVIKARNKLDARFYAIKKITQNTISALDNVLSEVILLSQLNHPYVVRYITAWVETKNEHEDNIASSSFSSADLSETSSAAGDDPTNNETLPESLDLMSGTGPDIVFGVDSDGDPDESDNYDDSKGLDECDTHIEAAQDDGHSNMDNPKLKSLKVGRHKAGDDDAIPKALDSLSSLGRLDAQRQARAVVFEDVEVSTAVLYIQMEFCEKKTLRSLINGNLYQDNFESWRLFKQIVDALAYIHAADIVHRDLKPENVFIDSVGDIRIGDFGLARPGELQVVQRTRSSKIGAYGSFTKSVGTAFYVAPEVRSASNSNYNDKADMYSLGIMFFEMCFPLKTGMERITVLSALRQNEHQLPKEFETQEKATQGEIILSLVDHDPALRPGSSELSHCGKFPTEMKQEQQARDVIRALRDDATGLLRQQVLRAIFAQADESSLAEHRDSQVTGVETFRMTSEEIDFAPKSALETTSSISLIRQWVRHQITAVFRRHGAIEADRPHIIPYAPHFARYRTTAVRVISKKGTILQLPYDLTVPNVHALAKTANVGRKIFTFATVYRENPGGPIPWTHQEVDFDIISTDADFLEINDAESIKVVDELLNAFPSMARIQMCYHLNHSRILNAILTFCDIPRSKWSLVKATLEKLNLEGYNWAKIRSELRSSNIGLRAASVEELIRFDFRDTPEEAFAALRENLQDSENHMFSDEFGQLRVLVENLKRMNVKRKIYLYPLSCVNERFFQNGMFFQCIYDTPKKAVFATGGRYDQLIAQYRPSDLPRSKVPDRHAVGFALNWDQICTTMSRFIKAGAKVKNRRKFDAENLDVVIPQRCDVLVEGPNPLLTTIGVEVVSDLWANEISAELSLDVVGKGTAYDPSDSATESHCWIVMLKQDGNIKVRNTAKREEDEMRASELAAWFHNEMRDRDRHEARAPGKAKLIRHMSHPESDGGSTAELRVRAIYNSESNKSKKINRPALVKEANLGAREAFQNLMESSIVAIETTNEVFHSIRNTNFTDPDSWRSTIQAAPAEERAYIKKIQVDMQTIAKNRRLQHVVLYNFRTKACELYDIRG